MNKTETTSVSIVTKNNNSVTTSKNVTTEVTPTNTNRQNVNDIPVLAFISMGIFVFILLSPIIRSASIGTTSFELATIDRAPDEEAELEFIEK